MTLKTCQILCRPFSLLSMFSEHYNGFYTIPKLNKAYRLKLSIFYFIWVATFVITTPCLVYYSVVRVLQIFVSLPGTTWCFFSPVVHEHTSVSRWCEIHLPPSLHTILTRRILLPGYPCEACNHLLAMCDNGDPEDKPPAPPVRMSSTIFSTGSGKDSLSANHSSKPLPSVPEERKRNKIISIFSGAEKSEIKRLNVWNKII